MSCFRCPYVEQGPSPPLHPHGESAVSLLAAQPRPMSHRPSADGICRPRLCGRMRRSHIVCRECHIHHGETAGWPGRTYSLEPADHLSCAPDVMTGSDNNRTTCFARVGSGINLPQFVRRKPPAGQEGPHVLSPSVDRGPDVVQAYRFDRDPAARL